MWILSLECVAIAPSRRPLYQKPNWFRQCADRKVPHTSADNAKRILKKQMHKKPTKQRRITKQTSEKNEVSRTQYRNVL